MKPKLLYVLVIVAMLLGTQVLAASAVGGAAFTTFNAHVDGASKDVCKQTDINCNLYGAKEYVWLNGGPTANHLKPDGKYFFAVLEPGGQPNPNDQGGVLDKNLSDDYDTYINRIFTVTNGEVSAYTGTHWLDNGKTGPKGVANGLPPYIRLYPYSDTRNNGGVYIMAICFIGTDGSGYPVDPRDCKYDAFKVKKNIKTFQFMLDGYKFNDYNEDGWVDTDEPGLSGWTITIKGTGAYGETIDTTATTGTGGYWFYESQEYTFKTTTQQEVNLKICEQAQDNWVQFAIPGVPDSQEATITVEGDCYRVVIPPDGIDYAYVGGLNFGNTPRGEVDGGKYYDANMNGQHDAGEAWLEGWEITYDSTSVFTGADGLFSLTLKPGDYSFAEVPGSNDGVNGWFQTGNLIYQGTTSGGATVDLADFIYDVTLPNDQPSTVTKLYFGNVCKWTPGGRTPGFWQNNNGQALITEDDLAELRALNLVNPDGSAFDPTTKEQVKDWILSDATNMAYKLSSFVAAVTLNINHGFTDPDVYVYVGAPYSDFFTVQGVLEEANTLLGLYPVTEEDDTGRAEQTAVKNVLDSVANQMNFVQPSPGTACEPAYPAP